MCQPRGNDLDGGANNDFVFSVIAGTAATTGSQVAPAVPAGAVVLAQVAVAGGSASIIAGNITDRRAPLNPRDTLHAKVYRNAAFTISNTATNVVPFDTVQRDPAGLWVPAQSGFVVPVAGLYLVVGAVIAAPAGSPASGQFLAVNVALNGAIVASNGVHQSMAFGFGSAVPTPVLAAAGGLIQTSASSNPNAVNGQVGLSSSFMTIDYLGTG